VKRAAALLACLGILVLTFQFRVRPWYLRWGATAEDLGRSLAGDEIVLRATHQETRAIAINAPIDRVWPWLAQLGQDRGGFYSYDLLENLVGCDMPTEDRLQASKQHWQLGDRLWMYPPRKAGGMGFATLRAYEPGRVLAFGTHAIGTPSTAPEDGSWVFLLEPSSPTTTRLVIRGRSVLPRTILARIFDRAVFEPAHFVMERRTMLGLKQLAETGHRSRTANHLQVGLWAVTFAVFLFSIWQAMRSIRPGHWLLGCLASGFLFQLLTLAQPGVVLGALLLTALALWLFAGNPSDPPLEVKFQAALHPWPGQTARTAI
jgi:hypothetical protein